MDEHQCIFAVPVERITDLRRGLTFLFQLSISRNFQASQPEGRENTMSEQPNIAMINYIVLKLMQSAKIESCNSSFPR